MDLLADFLAWAWPRHLNPLSWYIRPLFFLPIAYFCWKRRPVALTVTMVAMLSSFFWFPAPEPGDIDPQMQGVLEMEKQLFADPTWVTWVSLAMIPVMLGGLCAAFWYRSLGWGLLVIDGALAFKIAWTIANSGSDGLATVLPLGLGALAMTIVIIAVARWRGYPLSLTSGVRGEHARDPETM
ncbi:hypothetical protein F4561_001973 [Lipingzhangella halophila]|uniref:Uncharacterized protein n=1 Tax=Lipingzhangella halophila TaxID=1783352 RepID=A0A7W7W287_9ACTN|nr:hypothetical protein [Lipingzhangella halophila]MBB4931153.1 hypothetical protein [Lipingzhangella halophila]